MGLLKRFLSSGIYLMALVGIFTLLPLSQNNTFTKCSVTSKRPSARPMAVSEKLSDELWKNHICGRPHELNMDKKGFSYEDDAYYGTFKVDVNSKVQYGTKEGIVSMDEITNNAQPKLPNSIVIANDGAMYWTDADTHYGSNDDLYLVFADGLGRLLKYDPITKRNTILIRNLHFENDVKLSGDESFVIVSEAGKYRIHKYVNKLS